MRLTLEARWIRLDVALFEPQPQPDTLDERGPGTHCADLSVSTSDAADGYSYDDTASIGYTRR